MVEATERVISTPLNIFYVKKVKPERCIRYHHNEPGSEIIYVHCEGCGFRRGRFCKYVEYEVECVDGLYPIGPDVTSQSAYDGCFIQWCCATCGEIIQIASSNSYENLQLVPQGCKYCGTPHVFLNKSLLGDKITFAVPVDHKTKYKKGGV